jgi:hypothetical protein
MALQSIEDLGTRSFVDVFQMVGRVEEEWFLFLDVFGIEGSVAVDYSPFCADIILVSLS